MSTTKARTQYLICKVRCKAGRTQNFERDGVDGNKYSLSDVGLSYELNTTECCHLFPTAKLTNQLDYIAVH